MFSSALQQALAINEDWNLGSERNICNTTKGLLREGVGFKTKDDKNIRVTGSEDKLTVD